ncbi:MAG: GNAT family N-acetyltransferase [Rhodoferax sp.]|nr:GNAT family N-acetyltransferase [Rhodoferax sp.]
MHRLLDYFSLLWTAVTGLLPWAHAEAVVRGPEARPLKALLVPIRTLRPRHRAAVLAHLLELSPADRYMRFGYAAQNALIESYVDGLNFDRDQVFGVFNRRLRLIAVAHLAYAQEPQTDRCAEFGVSVLPAYRGKGLGAKLFARAQLHAQNDGISLLFIHALSENGAMLKIARKAGATVQRFGSESDAYLQLPSPTLQSHMNEAVDAQIADTDYCLKVQAQQFWGILAGIQEVRQQIRESQGKSSS